MSLCINGVHSGYAISITTYNPEAYRLFVSGFLTENPAFNESEQFVGGGYDWPGVGWNHSPGDSGRVQMFGMLSPIHAYSAWHYNLAASQPWDSNRINVQFVNSDETTINGVISGVGGLAKDDGGILTLNAVNEYQGETFLHNGTLRLGVSGALPSDSDLVFGSRGFATLDLNGFDTTLSRMRTVVGQGNSRILLGGAELTIALPTGELNVFGGEILGAGTVVKAGNGTWALTGAMAYAGDTEISGGVLRFAQVPSNSNVILSGGVMEIGDDGFSAQFGSSAGQVRFAGSGGFSAYGGTRVVNFGGMQEALIWGQPYFVGTGERLMFSSLHSDSGNWTWLNPFLPENQISVYDNIPDSGRQTITVRDNVPLGPNLRRFMRLNAQLD